MQQLLEARVPCNEAMAHHPTIQVGNSRDTDDPERPYTVGLLGILNGLFLPLENGWGPIMAELDDQENRLIRFLKTEDYLRDYTEWNEQK